MDWLVYIATAAVAFLVSLLVTHQKGKATGKKEATETIEREQAQATVQTTKDVQDAVEGSRLGGNDWHDRLVQSKAPRDK